MKKIKINKKELMLTDYPERLGRLLMAADWYLRYEKHETQGLIARQQLNEQVQIATRYIEEKYKENKRLEKANGKR